MMHIFLFIIIISGIAPKKMSINVKRQQPQHLSIQTYTCVTHINYIIHFKMGFYILCRTLCACAVCRSMNNIYIMFDVEALAKKKKKNSVHTRSLLKLFLTLCLVCVFRLTKTYSSSCERMPPPSTPYPDHTNIHETRHISWHSLHCATDNNTKIYFMCCMYVFCSAMCFSANDSL